MSMGFSRQEYWSGLPFPSPGDLPDPGMELASPASLALAGRFFPTEPPGKSFDSLRSHGLYSPWNSLGQNTGWIAVLFSRGMFPIQGSNPGIPHCRHILYQLSHQGRVVNSPGKYTEPGGK